MHGKQTNSSEVLKILLNFQYLMIAASITESDINPPNNYYEMQYNVVRIDTRGAQRRAYAAFCTHPLLNLLLGGLHRHMRILFHMNLFYQDKFLFCSLKLITCITEANNKCGLFNIFILTKTQTFIVQCQ
uniref:Uncharacterized protein n=1 Tax=Arundo donax TaxID=35708 RepID=A0A0A9EA18_ARUDO